MSFFDLDKEKQRIVTTPEIWIYVISSVILTIATFSIYYWVLHHDGPVLSSMAPKVHIPELRMLARRTLTIKEESVKKPEAMSV